MSHRFYVIIANYFTFLSLLAGTRYAAPQNNFSPLISAATPQAGIELSAGDKYLTIKNSNNHPYILTDTTRLPLDYCYMAKIANTANRPGMKSSCWGIAFDIMPNGDMFTVELVSDNDTHNDIGTQRFLTLSLNRIDRYGTTNLKTVQITKGANLYTETNVISVSTTGNEIQVGIGRKDIKTVLKYETARTNNSFKAGIIVGAGANVQVARTMTNYKNSAVPPEITKWTKEKLDEHFTKSIDPAEGYWQYLDRDMEDNIMRLGGEYTIAIVKNKNGQYDVIYVSGAKVNSSAWKPYMTKGSMTPTIFSNTFKGKWIDSTYEPITEDVQVDIENSVILSFKFPVFKSCLRFSKVLDTN